VTRIKICGLTDVASARVAAEHGADFIGLVFAPGRRQVSGDAAMQIMAVLRGREPRPGIVGVFVNAPAAEVNRVARFFHLDRVQLSGDETADYCREIGFPLIKVLHVSLDTTAAQAAARLGEYRAQLPPDTLYLLDNKEGAAYGGTGRCFAWEVAAALPGPFLVAGGLTPENVGGLIRAVRPWGVDVSSGVETARRKDIVKIGDFIRAVRSADGGRD